MKKYIAFVGGIVILAAWLPWFIAAWDNTLPADTSTWNNAAGEIRANWDALEAAFGVDLDTPSGSMVYNVKDSEYGATGDGSTDDTAAIQAAIDAATSGGIIYFPVGEYLCKSSLLANQASLRFVGVTPTSSHLADLSDASVILLGSNADLITLSVTSCSFENLYFDGNSYTGPLVRIGTGSSISATNFRDCTFLNGIPAIYAENALHGSFMGCTFRDCGNGTTTPAIEFYNGDNASTNSSDWTFYACTWEDVSGDSIEFDSGGAGDNNSGFYFYGPKHESADSAGFVFLKGTANEVQIYGGHMKHEDGTNVVSLTGNHNKFFGCHFEATTVAVTLTGNGNVIMACLTNCTNAGAGANFVITGDTNKIIGNVRAGYGTISSTTGDNNTHLAGRNSIFDGLTPPTSGTSTVGDIVFDYNPTLGRPLGWMCRVTGNPGTWGDIGRMTGATAKTGSYTCVVGETGRMFSNEGDADTLLFTLPAATVGLRYSFIRLASFMVKIDPDGTETIRGGGAGKQLRLDANGNMAVLECFESGKWEIIAEHLNDGGGHTFEP